MKTPRASVLPLVLVLALAVPACEADVSTPEKSDTSGGGGDVPGGGDGAGGDAITAPNFAPGPVEIRLDPAEPRATDDLVVAIVEEATDPDGQPEPVTYVARWYKDGALTPHSGLTLTSQFVSRGEAWTVAVAAFDGQDEGPPATAETEIRNSRPVVDGASITPGEATTETLLVCQAGLRSDPDGDDVSLRWWWALDDVLVESATTSAMAPPLKAGGRYRCAAVPFDGEDEGDPAWSQEVVPVPALTFQPRIKLQPKSIDLGVVFPGEVSKATGTLYNIGDGDLILTDAKLTGDAGFGIDVDLPALLAPGESLGFEVSFATSSPGLKKGTVSFESNALNQAEGNLPLLGIGAAPCLQVAPVKLDFGGAYVASNHELPVQLFSCGAMPVTIESIALLAPDGTPFALDLSPGPGPLPWTLGAGEKVNVKVRFNPLKASPVDAGDNPIPETATVSILRDDGKPPIEIPVSGFGSKTGCPVPVIHVLEGKKVAPGTLLHLDGSQSLAPGGEPTIYSWAVTTPPGAPAASFQPGSDAAQVTYPAEVLGDYVFQLKVFDEVDGNLVLGCSTATWKVTVTNATPIIVRLTWDTPGDPNQNDTGPGVGADLDLHMHNGMGSGPDYDGDGAPDSWFDFVNDLYWFDTTPDWGEPGDKGDPELAKEDPDGKGPERIVFKLPQAGADYTIGAYCWSSYDYGPSVAKVEIEVFEELIATQTDVVLDTGDLWEVGVLSWPSGQFTPSAGAAGGPKVTTGYPNPF